MYKEDDACEKAYRGKTGKLLMCFQWFVFCVTMNHDIIPSDTAEHRCEMCEGWSIVFAIGGSFLS